jgi:hypothetical protein
VDPKLFFSVPDLAPTLRLRPAQDPDLIPDPTPGYFLNMQFKT